MIEIIGYVGLLLLLISYYMSVTKKYKEKFYLINLIASLILTIYAILIGNLVFVFVNGFVSGLMLRYLVKNGKRPRWFSKHSKKRTKK